MASASLNSVSSTTAEGDESSSLNPELEERDASLNPVSKKEQTGFAHAAERHAIVWRVVDALCAPLSDGGFGNGVARSLVQAIVEESVFDAEARA